MSGRCRVRETNEYRAFLDQLTAGIIDNVGQYEDGSVALAVPEETRRFFNPRNRKCEDEEDRAEEEVASRRSDRSSRESEW